jgi:hypothetical protein
VLYKPNEAQQDSDGDYTEHNDGGDYDTNNTKRKTRNDYDEPGDEVRDEELDQNYTVPHRETLYELNHGLNACGLNACGMVHGYR